MENFFYNDNCDINDDSFPFFSVDKGSLINNTDSFEDYEDYEDNFYPDYKKFYEQNININNRLCALPTKSTMNEKKNNDKDNDKDKDKISQIKANEANINNSIEKDKNVTKKKGLLGRKKKDDIRKGNHNKFSQDNLRRKCKHLVLESAFNFINDKIKEKYKGNIGNGIFIKQLLILNHKQKSDASIQFNKYFLNKTLGDIFSEKISSRYTMYKSFHNKCLIQILTGNEDEEKKIYFSKLFSITFVDCLRHFRGSKKIEELEGMNGFDKIKSKYENDADYLKSLEYYIIHYEEIMNNKRARKDNKKNGINEL